MKIFALFALINALGSAGYAVPAGYAAPARAHVTRVGSAPHAVTTDGGIRARVLGLPFAAVRGLWQRCTPDACSVGRPRPLEFLKSFIPQRRPLARLVRNECSEGIYKVERQPGSGRQIKMFPFPRAKEECTIEDAMDFM